MRPSVRPICVALASSLLAAGCAAPLGNFADDDVRTGRSAGAVAADRCDHPKGVEHDGKRRFMTGVNFPWNRFGLDFGGLSRLEQASISQSPRTYQAVLTDMRAHGATVVRWWVLPDFRGDGVLFDEKGRLTGLGSTTVADLQKALELSAKADVYLMLCLFSFDGFRPTREEDGARIVGISPIVRDPAARKALVDAVVRPLARAAQASEYRDRLLSWDVINEPEWALHGANPYGDPAYTPMKGLDTVEHAQMEAFVEETVAALHEETPGAKVTVGSAGVKWAHAWKNVGLDFYQVHWYDWLDAYWPHDRPPESYGLGDKPVVVGEFPVSGMAGKDLRALMDTWYAKGYAGALGWAYDQMKEGELGGLKAFAEIHGCQARYADPLPFGSTPRRARSASAMSLL
jgi:hypothetical protein